MVADPLLQVATSDRIFLGKVKFSKDLLKRTLIFFSKKKKLRKRACSQEFLPPGLRRRNKSSLKLSPPGWCRPLPAVRRSGLRPLFFVLGRLGGGSWAIFGASSFAVEVWSDFFSIFGRFGMDFGRILGWFFDDFLYYFGKLRFCKKCGFTKGNPRFLRVRAIKKQW